MDSSFVGDLQLDNNQMKEDSHFMTNKRKKKAKMIVKHDKRGNSQDSFKQKDSSNEVYPCMRKEINSWDRHMMLMFNFSRKS